LESLNEQTTELTLYCHQPYRDVLAMSLSSVQGLFSSKAFAGWKKAREQDIKLQIAIIERLDGVTKAIGNLAKIIAKKPS
jgi:hypothetical protein